MLGIICQFTGIYFCFNSKTINKGLALIAIPLLIDIFVFLLI
jgi:hypothetical protein